MSFSSADSIFSMSSVCTEDSGAAMLTASQSSTHKRKTSAEHNAAMREIIKAWGSLPASPASCQRVMYSSWSRFSPSEISTKSSEEFKVSVLLCVSGTTPDFNPPRAERVYLGVDQPSVPQCGKPRERRQRQQRPRPRQPQPVKRAQSGLRSSWSTETSDVEDDGNVKATVFEKKVVQSPITNSLLTEGIKSREASPQKQPTPAVGLAKASGKPVLSASMLPSAFDSDSEDEE